MIIHYRDADGRIIELEVTEEVGEFYLSSLEEEKSNERRETRRHTLLSQFEHEDAEFFDSGIDICGDFAMSDLVERALSKLSARQRYLVTKVYIDGWRYSELAVQEKRYETNIRRATEKAKEKFIKSLHEEMIGFGSSRGL